MMSPSRRVACASAFLSLVLCAARVPAAPAEPAPGAGAAPAAPSSPVGRPWLGLSIEKGEAGVRVREVLPDAPCAAADVHPGDEVLAVGETKVAQPKDLVAAVHKAGVGAKLTLRVRGPQGAERQVPVTLTPFPNLRDWQRGALVGKQGPEIAPQVLFGPPLASLHAATAKGEVVVLDFFASWCGPCMRSLPALSALARRHEAAGLRLVGISAENAETIGKVVRGHRLSYTVAMDAGEQATRAYRIHSFPTLVVIDRQGLVRAVTADVDEAERAARAALLEPRPAGAVGGR